MTRTVPVSATQVVGNPITSALWNAGPAASNTFFTGPPLAEICQVSAATSLANNSWTSVGCDTTVYDPDSTHSNVTNNSRVTIQVAGKYLVTGAVSFVANATGSRGARIAKTGSPWQGTQQLVSSQAGIELTIGAVPAIIAVVVGDYLEVQGFQNSGGALNTQINNADGSTSQLTALWVSN